MLIQSTYLLHTELIIEYIADVNEDGPEINTSKGTVVYSFSHT
jgi:hypothetical protein